MPGSIAVVTDSTAYLPPGRAADRGIRVVPVHVVLGGVEHSEGVDVTGDQVAEALRQWVPVTTSRPSPQAFLDVYLAEAEAGAEGIVSIHLSADMSGTYEAARLAAKESPIPVEVVDSRGIGMALGFAADTAARASERGLPLEECAALAEARARAASVYFYVDTLEYLRRGGRIGPAAKLLGSALAVKPLLHLVDGRITPLEKVRTTSKAIARLEEIAVERATGQVADLAVHHLANEARARVLAARLRERLPEAGEIVVGELGAVVGAHVGPGMLAVVVAPR